MKKILRLAAAAVVFGSWLAAADDVTNTSVGPMRSGELARSITLPVEANKTLVLDAKGISQVHAAWADARLVRRNGSAINLADIQPVIVPAESELFRNRGPDGKPLQIADRIFTNGVFVKADCRMIYAVDSDCVRFEAFVGLNHTAGTNGQITFTATSTSLEHSLVELIPLSATELTETSLDAFLKSLDALTALKPERADYFSSCKEKTQALRPRLMELRASAEHYDRNALTEFAAFLELKRAAMTTLLDKPLLFVKRHAYFAPHIYDSYLTYRPGGGIYVIENPGDPIAMHRVRPIIDPTTKETLGEGVYRDPDLSWDGTRMLFAFKGANRNTSIYEIGLDGTGLRRITDTDKVCACKKNPPRLSGGGQHDVNPCYLPDGRIVFTSTRPGGLVMCFNSYIDTLHTCNADGSDLKCISVNNQNEFDPSILPDGRILYGRWEYVDKTARYMQSLWTVNPDGSQETALFKNNLAKPTAVLQARAVPGTDWVVASLTPHNGQPVGAIAMIDSKKGKNSLAAIANFTPEYPTEMDQGLSRGPSDPWPLNKDFVLIANNSQNVGTHGVLQLIDRFGTRVIVHSETNISCYAPMPVASRPRPPVIPSLIQPGKPALFLIQDIYQGMTDVTRGAVKKLRVIETTSRISGIPGGGRWWNQAFLASWQGSYDIKRVIGVVNVESDGSAYFEAPPGKALYFQALDADGRLVQSQRTFVQAVQGVTRACVGCHIKEDNIAPLNRDMRPLALEKPPVQIQPEIWGGGFLNYPTMVQPVLDRNCVRCHGGTNGIDGGIDLSGGWTWAFNISYETLIKNTLTGFLNCENGSVRTAEILAPRMHGSAIAPLATLLLSGHKGRIKTMTRPEIDLLLAWMDLNSGYYGTFDYSEHATCNALPKIREPLLAEMDKAGCVRCHGKAIGNDWVNLQNPERSRILRAPLAKNSGLGLGWCRETKAVINADRPFIVNGNQPPDVFRPARKPAPNPGGLPVVSFADTNAPAYQAMLTIIRQTRDAALKEPRVDMPGAVIIPGVCRDLPPLTPPQMP